MSPAAIVLILFAFEFADQNLPIDLDRLPPGAKARLGSARYNGQRSFSPDGKLVAVLPDCWALRSELFINVHDAETGKHLRTLRPPRDRERSIQWIRFVSPTTLLAGDSINAYELYTFDATTGRCDTVLDSMEHSGNWSSLGWVSDDARIAIECNPVEVGNEKQREYIVWQTKPLKKLNTIRPIHRVQGNPWVAWATLSRDGSTLLTGGYNATKDSTDHIFVQVWDTKTGKERRQFEVEDGRYPSWLALNHDGSRIAVAMKKSIQVFDTHSGKTAFTIHKEARKDDGIQFDQSGTRLLLHHTRTVTAFSASDGKELKEYALPEECDPEWDYSVRFTKAGEPRILADSSPSVWNLETGKRLGECAGHGGGIETLRFSSDGKRLTSIDLGWPGGGELTWDLTKRLALEPFARVAKLEGRRNHEWWEAWRSPDGKLLLAWTTPREEFKSSIIAFDVNTAKKAYEIQLPDWLGSWGGRSVDFSPDGKAFLRTGSAEQTTGDFPIYETATGKVAFTVKLENVYEIAASFSPDGTGLALLTSKIEKEKTVRELVLLDTTTGNERRRLTAPEGTRGVTLLADNRSVLVLSAPKSDRIQLSLWDTQTGKVVRSRTAEASWAAIGMNSQAFKYGVLSPDGKLLGYLAYDGSERTHDGSYRINIHVIETDTLIERAVFPSPRGRSAFGYTPGTLTAMAFSPDNRTLATGIIDGTILLYDIPPAKKPNPK